MFNKAKWIAFEGSAPLFRKEFSLREKPSAATLNICGLGLYTAELNGKPVGDEVLSPPVSRFDKTVYYNEFDVLPLLNNGGNCIGVTVGNGWYNYPTGYTWNFDKADWRHQPKMIACLTVRYADGSEEKIISDTTWKASTGPVTYNFPREGEDYDARLYINGWNLAGFDASGWKNAVIIRSPGGILKKAVCPPIRIRKKHAVAHNYGNIYDFGVNMSGWIKITVKGNAGSEIFIRYSERFSQEEGLDTKNINAFSNTGRGHCDKYILAGTGEEESWHPVFVYHGFRYTEITITGEAQIIKLEAQELHTDLQSAGSFECGDEMLNKIHAASVQATLSNYHGIPTDCPHREQNGWTGDASLSAEQALMNFDIAPAYRKWMLDFKDAQRPSGQIPGIIPTSSWGYNWGSGPAWDSALILIPLAIYELNGDISVTEMMWENMELYMEYFDSMADGYLAEFGIGDWCAPKETVRISSMITDTAYYYVDALAMAKLAAAIGNGREGHYLNLAKNIKTAFRSKFLKDGEVIFNESQTAIACAIYQGLLEGDEIPKAAGRLASLVREKGNHIDCGILGAKYIFSALSENGYAETAYDFVVNPDYPSYAHWINSGMTALCEDWKMGNSLNHHMFSEVDYWFYRHLAGIRPAEPGFKTVDIIPRFIDKIGWVKASHKGITVYWDKEKLVLTTPVPARVFIGNKCHEAVPGTHEFKR